MSNSTNSYNEEPVLYCAKCYSLKIQHEDTIDTDFCGDCGCSDILSSPIEKWETLYEQRYGKKYVRYNNGYKGSSISKYSITDLKNWLFRNPNWKEIIHVFYPKFPSGYCKADMLILFFDKLITDNRIDELKVYIFQTTKK